MDEDFKIEIVSPESSFFSNENVKEVIVPAFEGEMGILKNHISIISFLKPGIIKVISNKSEDKFYVDDGIMEFKDNELSILTSTIFNINNIDNLTNVVVHFKLEVYKKLQKELLNFVSN